MMRNPNAPHINFEDIAGLLGNLVPSNIDMVLERKGHFLIGEWKRKNEKISKGQEILLKSFAKQPNTTVLVVSGDTDNGMVVRKFWKLDKYGTCNQVGLGLDAFKDYIVDWYLRADLTTTPTPTSSLSSLTFP
jgi:hypothetical protein